MTKRILLAAVLSLSALPALAVPAGLPTALPPIRSTVTVQATYTNSDTVALYRKIRAFWLTKGIVR